MEPTFWTYPAIAVSAAAAGAINAVAGGGTLLTFPTLLTVLHPVAANATSTMALMPGSLAGAAGYRAELSRTKPMLKLLWLPSLLGGIGGSLAVTRFPESVFDALIPWLLILASGLLVLQRPIARWIGAHPTQQPKQSTKTAIVFFQFLVGVYGGYFGAGIGILMLSSLAFMGISDINEMNALKTVLAALINGVTVAVFILEGAVVWKYAVVMAAASIVGGYAGAHTARRLPQQWVRAFVVGVGFSVAGYTLLKRFLG